MIQVCDLSFANSSITDTLGNYSLVSSGTVTISGVPYPANTDPILYVTDSSYNCIEFGQTATYSNGAIIQAGVPTYGSENWSVEFRARVTVAMPEYYENCVIFYGCRAPYDYNGTLRMGGHWSISINYDLNALEFGYVDHYDILTIKDNLDFTAWHLYKVTKTAEEILTLHIDGVLVATIDLEQQIGYKTHATLGSFVLLGDADWSPTANRIHTDQAVRLADVKVYADPMGHAEKAISLDNLSRVFRNYNTWLSSQLSGVVGDGTLTIQQNGTNVATFTANASTNAAANITVPTKTSDLTNDSGFITEDTTKIPLAGSNQISGSLIPSTDNSIDIGSSTKNIKMLYTKGITIDGAQFLPSDYVPRSGGAVMTGTNISRAVNDSFFIVYGGDGWRDGSSVALSGKDNSSGPGYATIYVDNGTQMKSMTLRPDGTWTWDGTAVQLISDQRLKQQISEIDDKLLDAWEDVNLVQFKYNDAVDAKKDKARLHTGYVVQQIDSACKSHNVDVSAYGLYCHEEYPEETEEVEVEQKDGTKVKETRVIREASEHYSLRYTEALVVECKYLRRCIARLTARIEELEKGKEQEASK